MITLRKLTQLPRWRWLIKKVKNNCTNLSWNLLALTRLQETQNINGSSVWLLGCKTEKSFVELLWTGASVCVCCHSEVHVTMCHVPTVVTHPRICMPHKGNTMCITRTRKVSQKRLITVVTDTGTHVRVGICKSMEKLRTMEYLSIVRIHHLLAAFLFGFWKLITSFWFLSR